jgi:SAM-dependent methyltransferase
LSATNRGGERRASDFYPTPIDLARRVVANLDSEPPRILEPSAGDGAFVVACRERWPGAEYWIAEPIAQKRNSLFANHKFETLEDLAAHPNHSFDLIVGNPPYSLAESHVQLCLGLLAPGGRLVFLLRLAFLESKKRASLWQESPLERVTVMHERPSFTANGKTDSCAYAVFCWRKGFVGKPALGWM